MRVTVSWQSMGSSARVVLSTEQRTPPGARVARFMELRGRKVVEACGALWHEVDGGFLISLPYELPLDPNSDELTRMLVANRAVGARFPSRTWAGLPSGVYLYREKQYSLQMVQSKERSKVRQGLQRFEIRLAKPGEMLEQGMQLNLDTMNRQGRYDPDYGEPRRFRRLVESAFELPEMQIFAAFHGRRMAAYLITCRDGGCLHLLAQMSRLADLKSGPNCALTYEVTRQGAQDPDLDSVCYGSVSLIPAPGLHQYKIKFGYEVAPHNSVVLLHPRLDWILKSSPALSLMGLARRLRPGSQTLKRAEMTLRAASQIHWK